MLLLPAFHKRKKNAGSIGRLVAGYGEIEFSIGLDCGNRARVPDTTQARDF